MRATSWLTSSLLALCVSTAAQASPDIDINASAEQKVTNDTLVISLSVENASVDAKALTALTDKGLADVSGKTSTHGGVRVIPGYRAITPVYSHAKGKEGTITSWRERADVQLESSNFADLYSLTSELLGAQKATVKVQDIDFKLSDTATKAIGEQLYAKALENYQAKADAIKSTLKREDHDTTYLSFDGPYVSQDGKMVRKNTDVDNLTSPEGLEPGESLLTSSPTKS